MQYRGVNELRKLFLDFFESKGHLKMKSFSLVPHNDNSLLIINSGMAPLKPYFTGQEIPPRRRVTTCQKCIRTGDIENVGKTARHGTFFEMLGNFSFGDYFKHEAIAWSWEFLTKVLGLEPDRLYPSIYEDDDEAFDIWKKEIGMHGRENLQIWTREDNFWEHGAGPCGPCSEIYYDRGEKYGCGSRTVRSAVTATVIWKYGTTYLPSLRMMAKVVILNLSQKNIDTGMGLERLAVVCQDVDSIFDVDTMKAIRDKVCELAGVTSTEMSTDVSIRVITDHIRSATFMLSDGIMPSNEGRGYVLRRLSPPCSKTWKILRNRWYFLSSLQQTVIEGKDGYPELEEKRLYLQSLSQEEEKFNKTIDQGLVHLRDMEEDMNRMAAEDLPVRCIQAL